MILFLIGLAAVGGGGTAVAVSLSSLDACGAQCDTAAVSSGLGVLVLVAGLVLLLAWGVRTVNAREDREVARRDRRLRDLELRLYRG